MKLRYSPVMYNECSPSCVGYLKDTTIEYIDENTILVDGKEYEFDLDTVIWDNVAAQTNGVILDARRVDGELWLVVRRYYTGIISPDWDTGGYHDIKG